MAKNILYVAAARDLATNNRLTTSKIGIAAHSADKRITQLNSTKMPISVELVGAWTFEHTHLSADDVEKAAHVLLAPYNVNGEWFNDPDDDLADRIGRFAQRLGAIPVGDDNAQLAELNEKQRAALNQMRTVFEPIAGQLAKLGINWEYMTWKIGMDSKFGRLNIEVRKTGQLYVRLEARGHDASELSDETGLEWKQGSQNRCFASMGPEQLITLAGQK